MTSPAVAMPGAPAAGGRPSRYATPGFWDALARTLRTGLVPHVAGDAGRLTCAPGWPWRARLADHVLWLVASGRGQAVVPNGRIRLRTGAALLLCPGDVVTVRSDDGTRLSALYAHFTLDRGSAGATAAAPDPTPPRFVQLVEPSDVHRRLNEVVRESRRGDPAGRLAADLMLAAVLVEVHRQAAHGAGGLGVDSLGGGHAAEMDPRVRRVVERLRADPAIRVEHRRAARWAGLSPAYFGRVFARSTGRTYRDFCLDLRMLHAERLLAEPARTVTDVATTLGYDDPRLFIRQFRERYGLPPGSWRAKYA